MLEGGFEADSSPSAPVTVLLVGEAPKWRAVPGRGGNGLLFCKLSVPCLVFMTSLMLSYGFNLVFCPFSVTHHMFPFQDQAESISSCTLTRFSSFWFISVRSSVMTYLVCFSALRDNMTRCFKSLLKNWKWWLVVCLCVCVPCDVQHQYQIPKCHLCEVSF